VDLSVVIPARDVAATLPEQLDALLDQRWDGEWEVVVVDNRSADGTGDVARSYAHRCPRVRVVDAPGRDGLCYARAVGVEAATGSAVAICDGDDVVAPGWVAAMGEALRAHPVVTGALEIDRLNPPWLAASRGRPSRTTGPTWYGCFPLVSGGNVGFRREVWREVGGFDEHFLGAEDAEFSLRLQRHGIPVRFVPEAVVHYRYRASARVLWHQGLQYGRGRPLLRRRMRDLGLSVPPPFAGWRSWAWLVVHLPGVATGAGRARWLWVAGNRVGHVLGSVHARTLFL
jgi:glycosyltransferase involved in cell wall biosynthesis